MSKPHCSSSRVAALLAICAAVLLIEFTGCALPYRVEIAAKDENDEPSDLFEKKVATDFSARETVWRARHDQLERAASRSRAGQRLPAGRVQDCVTSIEALAHRIPELEDICADAVQQYESLGESQISSPRFVVRRLEKLERKVTRAIGAVIDSASPPTEANPAS